MKELSFLNQCHNHSETHADSFTYFLFQQPNPSMIDYYRYLQTKLDVKFGLTVPIGYYETALAFLMDGENKKEEDYDFDKYLRKSSSFQKIEDTLKESLKTIKKLKIDYPLNVSKCFPRPSDQSPELKSIDDENDITYLQILNLMNVLHRIMTQVTSVFVAFRISISVKRKHQCELISEILDNACIKRYTFPNFLKQWSSQA